MSSTVFIVLPTDHIGGAEKRFAGLCAFHRSRGRDVRLVVTPEFRRRMGSVDELGDLAVDAHAFVEVASAARRDMLRGLTRLRLREPTAVFHDVLVSPLVAHVVPPRKTLFTIPNSSLGQYNRKGLAFVLGGVVAASRIDVLDPDVHARLQRTFFWKKAAITLTPGSFVDARRYVPANVKRNVLAFCGLFSDEKQIGRLVDAIPVIDAELRTVGIHDAAFRLLGRETNTSGIAERCAFLRPTVDVEAYFEPNPSSVLASAKVFFSLQRTTNHPSKALLEALACGCLPVVTDTGSTRRSAKKEFSFYVSGDFTPQEIAAACVSAMTLQESERSARVAAMRALVEREFTVDAMAAYYARLWDEV